MTNDAASVRWAGHFLLGLEVDDQRVGGTAKQGQYLAFIDYYSKIHGTPPAEADFRQFFRVTPPVVHQMIKTLDARGFIDREPGKPRSIKLRLTRAQLPDLD